MFAVVSLIIYFVSLGCLTSFVSVSVSVLVNHLISILNFQSSPSFFPSLNAPLELVSSQTVASLAVTTLKW
jgi:hypothetical protein